MPTSVKDRFNESWEYLYFFTKSKKYYSDLDAVRLPPQTFENRPAGVVREREFGYNTDYPEVRNPKFNYRVRDAERKSGQPQFKASEEEIRNYKKQDNVPSRNAALYKGFNQRWKDQRGGLKKYTSDYIAPKGPKMGQDENRQEWPSQTPNWGNVLGKNLPTVWLIQSEPHNFRRELGVDADHFAIFPQDLVEIPIKFGTPPRGIILDPFMGSGTTAIVAKKLGRNYIGIELNSEYVKIAEKRLEMECPPALL